ncbi:hypothetical protein [Natronorubrum sp. DTA28]|uniref:hypothetical protein n=1 Tax=Natronorubrum sp. DTA28 TaxID=3447019 RepID=UPI003F87EB70
MVSGEREWDGSERTERFANNALESGQAPISRPTHGVSMIPLFVTPVEILTGVSVALLFGTVCAAVVGCATVVIGYVADEPVPSVVGGVATVAITGVGLYAAAVVDSSTIQPGLLLGVGLSFVLGLYATSWGRQLAVDLPRTTAGSSERTQPLAADAIDAVDAMGQVTIRSSGGVREFEGYPPLGPELRATLEDGAWRLPADCPLSELETRLEDRLRTSYGFEAVSVSVDGRGRATITAAPPANSVAKRVPEGWRAVSTRALLPTGLAPGDDVLVATESTTVSGTVLSATVAPVADGGYTSPNTAPHDDGPGDTRSKSGSGSLSPDAVTAGGDGYVTVAVPTTDADVLLEGEQARIVVRPSGSTHEFDAISLLERDGTAIRQKTVTDAVRNTVSDKESDLDVFATRNGEPSGSEPAAEYEWRFEPDSDALEIGSEVFLLGSDVAAFGPEPDEGGERDEGEPATPEVSH